MNCPNAPRWIHRAVIKYISRSRWTVEAIWQAHLSSFLSHFRQNSQNNIIPAFYTPLPTRRPLPPAPLSSHAAPLHHQLSLKPPVSTQRKRSVFAIVSTCGSSARRERFLVRDKCVKSLLATSVSLKTNSSQNASPTSPLRNLHLREMSAVRLSHC